LTTQSIAKVKNEWSFYTLYLTLSCLECSYTEATLCSPLLRDYDNSDNTVTRCGPNYWGFNAEYRQGILLHQHIHTNYRAHPTYHPGAISDLSLDIKWFVCVKLSTDLHLVLTLRIS